MSSRHPDDIGDTDLACSDVRMVVAVAAEQRTADEEHRAETHHGRDNGQDQRSSAS